MWALKGDLHLSWMAHSEERSHKWPLRWWGTLERSSDGWQGKWVPWDAFESALFEVSKFLRTQRAIVELLFIYGLVCDLPCGLFSFAWVGFYLKVKECFSNLTGSITHPYSCCGYFFEAKDLFLCKYTIFSVPWRHSYGQIPFTKRKCSLLEYKETCNAHWWVFIVALVLGKGIYKEV